MKSPYSDIFANHIEFVKKCPLSMKNSINFEVQQLEFRLFYRFCMINPRRTAPQTTQRKIHVLPTTAKPSTGLKIPLMPFNPAQKFTSQGEFPSKFSSKTERIQNTSANRTLPISRCTNNSAFVNSFALETPNQSRCKTIAQNVKPIQFKVAKREGPNCPNSLVPSSKNFDKFELLQLQKTNQELHAANIQYAQRLSDMRIELNNVRAHESLRNCQIGSNLYPHKICDTMTKIGERSRANVSINGFARTDQSLIDDLPFKSEFDYVQEPPQNVEAQKFKCLLQETKSQLQRLQGLFDRSRINQALLGKKVQGLEALVEFLYGKNVEMDQQTKYLRSSSCQKENTEKVRLLEEYKKKFNELSIKSEQNNFFNEEKLNEYQITIQNLKDLLAKANIELASRNQAISELDETYKHNEEMLLQRLQMVTLQMTSYYQSFNEDLSKIKGMYETKQNCQVDKQIGNKILELTSENKSLRKRLLDIENKELEKDLLNLHSNLMNQCELDQQIVPRTPQKNRKRQQLPVVREQLSAEPNASERKETEISEPYGTEINIEVVVTNQEEQGHNIDKTKRATQAEDLKFEIERLKEFQNLYEQMKEKYLKLREQVKKFVEVDYKSNRNSSKSSLSNSDSMSNDTVPIPDDCLKIKLYYQETIESLQQKIVDQEAQIVSLKTTQLNPKNNTVSTSQKENLRTKQMNDCCKQIANKYDKLIFRYSLDLNHLKKQKDNIQTSLSLALSENNMLRIKLEEIRVSQLK